MDNEQEEQTIETAVVSQEQDEKPRIRRVRLLSPRKQLAVTLQRMEKLAQSNTLKETKLADLLLSMGDLQKMLLKLTTDEEQKTLQDEHAQLTEQHAADAARIAKLEAENDRLKSHRCETTVINRTDPEAAQLREQNTALRDILKALITPLDIDARARLAIQVILQKPEHVARMFLPLIQIDYAKYRRLLNEYRTEQQLFDVIERTVEESTGDLVVFCRACLTVVYGVPVSSRKPKKKEFDPTIFRRIEGEMAELGAQRERLEAQRTSPASIDGGEF
jgi:hypothetical protein